MTKIFLFSCFIFSFSLFSQKKYAKKFQFKNDNDLYVSAHRDKYYTNGMFLTYSYLSKKNKNTKIEKRIIDWQIGHQMYTPYLSTLILASKHDRPFASYLFGSHAVHKFYKNNRILTTEIQFGIIGPAAFGKELQTFIHNIYDFKEPIGWKYQIKNAVGLNYNTTYIKPLGKDTSNKYDISWYNNAKIGTIFTDISTGIYTRLGFKPLQKLVNSIAFNANLNNSTTNYTNQKESFIFIKPTISYVMYDATIQGSFLNTSSSITKEVIPFKFDLEVGFKFIARNLNLIYSAHYHTNKSKNLHHTNGNLYGTIEINYLFN